MVKAKGEIIPNGVILETHEMKTVVWLTEQGYDVELIPKSEINGVKTPDILMDKIKWEMKSPTGRGRWTIESHLRRAMHQSPYIIFDSRRIKIPSEKVKHEIEKQVKALKPIKHVLLITKYGKRLDFEK